MCYIKDETRRFTNAGLILLSFILQIAIFTLDVIIQIETLDRASIAINQFNKNVSYNEINIAFYVFASIYIVSLFSIIFIVLNRLRISALLSAFFLLLAEIVRQVLVYKFTTCFNYPDNIFLIVRAGLSITFLIPIFTFHLLEFLHPIDVFTPFDRFLSFTRIPALIVSICTMVVIFAINLVILIKLKSELPYNLVPETIDMGYFTRTEISKIVNGNYFKETNEYETRLIGKLGNIVFSEEKLFLYKVCRKNGCENVYARKYNYRVNCDTQTPQIFRIDCINATYLEIQVKYIDKGAYPYYNCAIYKNVSEAKCFTGCQSLGETYQLYLTLHNSDTGRIEQAWRNFGNCEVTQPSYELTKNKTLDVCDKSLAIKVGLSSVQMILITLFSLILMSF